MATSIAQIFRELNFNEYHRILLQNSYYDVLFPFLLVFAVLYSVLLSKKIKIFHNKKGEPYSAVVFVISGIVSFYGVSFETSPGRNVGSLMMTMFPNISALTMGILMLYIIGAMLGKSFFHGMFSKKWDSIVFMVVGGIGLGAVIFYTGIAMGFWNYNPLDALSYWNVVLAVFFLILGIVFMVVDYVPLGILFLSIFGIFVFNYGEGNILELFIDPVVFIVFIIIVLLMWMNSDKEHKFFVRRDLNDEIRQKEAYEKELGRKPEDYESRIHDIIDTQFEKNIEEWKKKWPEDEWRVKRKGEK